MIKTSRAACQSPPPEFKQEPQHNIFTISSSFFTLYTLGSNGHHHPCLPSSVLFTLSPQTVSWSCPPESFSRPPPVMIDDKLLRGRKHVSWQHAEPLRQKVPSAGSPTCCTSWERKVSGWEGGSVAVNKSLKGTLQHLMRKKALSLPLRSAVNYRETCAVTPSSQ